MTDALTLAKHLRRSKDKQHREAARLLVKMAADNHALCDEIIEHAEYGYEAFCAGYRAGELAASRAALKKARQ